MLLHNTTAVDIITLEFMTFGVWHERDGGKEARELNSEVQNLTLFYSPKREIFVVS